MHSRSWLELYRGEGGGKTEAARNRFKILVPEPRKKERKENRVLL